MADGVIEEVLRLNAGEAKVALADVAQEATKTSAAIGHVGNTSKISSAHLGNLAFQLNDVATMAALGASPFQILASQGGQLVQVAAQAGGVIPLMSAAIKAAGAAAAAAAPVLIPLAIAAGAVYVAFRAWGLEAEQAAEATQKLIEKSEALSAASKQSDTATVAVTDKIALLLGRTDEYQLKLERETDQLIEARQAKEDFLGAQIAEAKALADTTSAYGEQDVKVRSLTKQLSEHANETADLIVLLQDAAGAERQAAKNARDKAEADKAAAEATKARNEASRRAAELAREEAKAFAALQREFTREATAAAALDGIFGSDPVSETRAKFEAQTTALMQAVSIYRDMNTLAEHAAEIDRARLTLAQNYTDEMNAAYAAMQAQAEGSTTAGDAYDPSAGATTAGPNRAADMANVAAQGVNGALSVVGQMGPVGAIVQAVLQLITAIGDGLLDSVHEWVMGLFDTIGKLPEVLTSAITKSITEGIPAMMDMIPRFIESFIASFPEMLQAGLMMIPQVVAGLLKLLITDLPKMAQAMIEMLADPQMWMDVAKAFVEALSGMFTGAFDGVNGKGGKTNVAGVIANPLGALVGAFADGTEYVSRTGIAMVHAGEEIRQKGGAWSSAAMADGGSASTGGYSGRARVGGSGGKITVEIDPADLAREMSRASSVQGLNFGSG